MMTNVQRTFAFSASAFFLGRRIVRIDHQEKRIAVNEVIVAPAEFFLPEFFLVVVGHLVVAGKVEKRHFQFMGIALKLAPFIDELGSVFAIAFDQVTYRDDELGLKQ